jgi:chromosome segregation ATPase
MKYRRRDIEKLKKHRKLKQQQKRYINQANKITSWKTMATKYPPKTVASNAYDFTANIKSPQDLLRQHIDYLRVTLEQITIQLDAAMDDQEEIEKNIEELSRMIDHFNGRLTEVGQKVTDRVCPRCEKAGEFEGDDYICRRCRIGEADAA